jgi:hypothetical protein
MWFRIELNKDRSVRTCVEVEGSIATRGGSVHYVEADTKEQAIRLLAARYDRRAELVNANKRKRKAAYATAGLCRECGAARAPGKSRCAKHLELRRLGKQRIRRGETRPVVRLSPAEKAAAVERQRAQVRDGVKKTYAKYGSGANYHRFRTLVKVLEAFDGMTPGNFRMWLVQQIEANGPREAPAQAAE